MAKPITMQEIADELGLSRLTVSSVVNNVARQRGVSEKTESRVREHLRQRGYVPSRHARLLREGDRDVVGVLHCGHLFSHLVEAFNHLTDVLISQSHLVETVVVRGQEKVRGLEELVSRRISTLIWIYTLESGNRLVDMPPLLPLLARFEKVIIHYYTPGSPELEEKLDELGVHRMIIDRSKGATTVATLLRDLGHRVVALPEQQAGPMPNRPNVQVDALRDAGLEVYGCRPPGARYDRSLKFGTALADGIVEMRDKHGVTAAWLGDDELAGYVMANLIRRGLRIPEDISVIGWDGMPFAEALAVPLTTMAVPVDTMVRRAVQLLEKDTGKYRHTFPPTLIERQSHGAAP